MVTPQPTIKKDDAKIYPEIEYFGYNSHDVYKKLWPDGEPERLPLEPSLKLAYHSPTGFSWGYSAPGVGSHISQTALSGYLSYETSRNSDHRVIERWNFVDKVEAGISKGYMNKEEPHSQSSSQKDFLWNVSLEFDSRIYQYSFALVGCDEVNEKLVSMTREINNLSKTFSGKVSISSKDFSLPTKSFRLCDIHPLEFSRSPDLPLKLEPSCFDCQVLISTLPIITSPRTVLAFPRSTRARTFIRGLPYNLATETTFNLFLHLILLSFYGYYNINNPTKSNHDGPAQLALALLLDATSDPDLALSYYQDFKQDKVAGWDFNGSWVIFRSEILNWLRLTYGRELEKRLNKN